MESFSAKYEYVESSGFKLFTAILKPSGKGVFPTVVMRNPYVLDLEDTDENEILSAYLKNYSKWLENGYAVVMQHCRGQGKSEGEFIPFIYEREDGRNLHEWIRHQDFYNGELFLVGYSYLAVVHCETAPFADDIKGLIIGVQDCNKYNFCYRNGFFKKGLVGDWYVTMYKAKSHIKKNYDKNSFDILPFKDFSKIVFGEPEAYFDDLLKAIRPEDSFWHTHACSKYTKNAMKELKTPILLITSFYDIFTSGNIAMWNDIQESTKEKSALLISPYDHSDCYNENLSIHFESGKRTEQFGEDFEIRWFDYLRGKREKAPFELNKVTYYRLFENVWKSDSFEPLENSIDVSLGEKEVSYKYDPDNAPRFAGGLSSNFGGALYQDKPYQRDDIITVYTEPFEKDVFVKGKMSANLKVKSDCEDTCFYMRINIVKEGGDFPLREDITSICYQLGDYEPGSKVSLDFTFDEHAFLIKKGEKLRIDISSADNLHYVRHTNNKGLFSEQTTTKIANNTIYLNESVLTLPIEE